MGVTLYCFVFGKVNVTVCEFKSIEERGSAVCQCLCLKQQLSAVVKCNESKRPIAAVVRLGRL